MYDYGIGGIVGVSLGSGGMVGDSLGSGGIVGVSLGSGGGGASIMIGPSPRGGTWSQLRSICSYM